MKKNKIIILSILLTCIVFMFIYNIEKKLANPNGTEMIYVVKAETIDEGQVFDDKNFDQYFKLEKRDKGTLTEDNKVSKEQIINCYAKQKLYKEEAINKNDIAANNERVNIKNRRTISLKFADIGDVVGGTLKKGDKIDILLTKTDQSNEEVKTTTKLENIYVDEVFSSDGKVINRDTDKETPALCVNLILTAQQGHDLKNAIESGKVSVMKINDSGEYSKITVISDEN